MALPDKPLEFLTDPGKLKLKDFKAIEADNFSVSRFTAFLVRNTNWTETEIDEIELNELQGVAEQLAEAIKSVSIPLAT